MSTSCARCVLALLVLLAASVAAGAAPALPTPPQGWKLEVVAAAPKVRHPSVVCCAPDGRVFVAEDPMDISLPSADARKGRVLCLHPDGRTTVFADGLYAVFGMQYLDGRLYVLHNPKFTTYRDDGTGVGAEPRDLIASTNPNPWALNWNDHVPANFRLAMDGYFYVAVGDKGLFGATGTDGKRVDLRGGGIVRIRPDGTGLEVFSTGVRNILDVAMNDEDEIFTYDNTDEHHWMGRLTHMVDGGFYGYPWDFVPRRPYTLWMMAEYGAGAATGTLAYNEDALPAEYHGNLFLADFGKRNILRVRVERQGATYRAVSREDLFTNVPPDFRPVGIALSPDGTSLYICDWQHVDTKEEVEVGRLLKLSYAGATNGAPKPRWYVQAATGKPFEATTEELVAALSHPSHDVRMVAQRRIAERPDARDMLMRLLENRSASPRARCHAVWSLDPLLKETPSPLTLQNALNDKSPLVRRQAIRRVATRRDATVGPQLVQRLREDGDAAVRFHAATALGRLGDPDGLGALILAPSWEQDGSVRYAAFTAVNRIGREHPATWPWVANGLRSSVPNVREGAALALRGTYDGALVEAVAAVAGTADSVDARVAALNVLAPLHRKLPEWKGEWWAYHPALAPPPRKTEAWAGTEAVLTALKKGLDDADRMVRLAALGGLREAGDAGAAPKIRELFSKGDADTKRQALEALATCDDGASVAVLLAYLDESQVLVGPVLLTLGRLKAADAVPALAKHAGSPDAGVRDAALTALVAVGGEAAKEAVAKLMEDGSIEVRSGAVRAAGELGDRALVPKLLEAYQSPRTSAAALVALARMPDVRAVEPYLEGLASGDFAVRERCRGALAEVRDAALPRVEAAVAARGLSDDVVLELQQVYKGHEQAARGPVMAAKVQRKHPSEYVEFAVNHAGDATRGEKLFAETTAGGLGCATCHAVGGRGGSVGPDLSGVGAKYARRELAEGVVFPSKVVREGYQQVTVRTKSGQVYSGPIKANTGQELTIHEPDGTLRRIPATDVAVRKDTGLSPMPENLHTGLTPEQFTDLVDYLESLKTETQEK